MPILLEECDFKLDEEFSRRLGVALLNVIALGQSDIKLCMDSHSGGHELRSRARDAF